MARVSRPPRVTRIARIHTERGARAQVRFPEAVLRAFDEARIIGVRAGAEHRYTGVWVVVVEERVFVRSWNDKPGGWYRAFRKQRDGSAQVGAREVAIRGAHTRSERLQRAVSDAYGRKYPTKASQKWVRGFATARRMATTLELVPR